MFIGTCCLKFVILIKCTYMHLLGFYTRVVFEALYAHLQVQYLSYKVKGFFFSGLMIKDKKLILESQN